MSDLPKTGGRWLRDPKTGALTRDDPVPPPPPRNPPEASKKGTAK